MGDKVKIIKDNLKFTKKLITRPDITVNIFCITNPNLSPRPHSIFSI